MRKKYFTEAILNVYSSSPILILPSELDKIETLDELKLDFKNRNIYLICKRPRITIVPDSIIYKDNQLSFQLKIHLQGQDIIKEVIDSYSDNDLEFKVSDYPHTKLLIFKKGNLLHEIPTLFIIGKGSDIFDGYNDLEVVYIGQAFGEDGSRSAIERLSSHSTLQKILADIATNEPNMEVILALYKFEYHQFFFSMDGQSNKVKIKGNKDKEHYLTIMKAKYKRSMNISLVEAGLIRYFEPKYNKIFKYGFPYNRKYKILDKVYELDFAGLTIEINTEEVNTKLYNDKIKKGYHHMANFDLHLEDDRKDFFYNAF